VFLHHHDDPQLKFTSKCSANSAAAAVFSVHALCCVAKGGRPIWLDARDLPTAKELQCASCNEPLTFLLQVSSMHDQSGKASYDDILLT
jgi:hypothetical protein